MEADFTHGQTGYTYHGCRCDVCQAANTTRFRRQRDKRLARAAQDPSLIPHGRGGYTNWGCRCEVCTKANTDACCAYRRARRERRKADEVAERILDATKTELPPAEQERLASYLRDRQGAENLPGYF